MNERNFIKIFRGLIYGITQDYKIAFYTYEENSKTYLPIIPK